MQAPVSHQTGGFLRPIEATPLHHPQSTKPAVRFVLHMKASDFSLTSIEPGATKRFDLRGTSRHDQKVAGQIISDALGLRVEKRHHKRMAAYRAATERDAPQEQPGAIVLSARSSERRHHRTRKHHSRKQAHAHVR